MDAGLSVAVSRNIEKTIQLYTAKSEQLVGRGRLDCLEAVEVVDLCKNDNAMYTCTLTRFF